ncbi:MAG: hypothetical protein ACI81A_000583, partial [Paraglaciecola sp.]
RCIFIFLLKQRNYVNIIYQLIKSKIPLTPIYIGVEVYCATCSSELNTSVTSKII